MAFEHITHVLFDMDGLILNTEELYTIAFQNVLTPYGKDFTYEMKLKLMGRQADETAHAIITELELPLSIAQFKEETRKQFVELFPDCEVLPGARELIEHLHSCNIPIGLATSSSEDSYSLKVDKRHSELFSLFKYKTFGSSDPQVKRGKPHPDIFLVAASKFPDKPKPEQILVLEDALNGVYAARAAGMPVVMVPDPMMDRDLIAEDILIFNSLELFLPELFSLPPFLY